MRREYKYTEAKLVMAEYDVSNERATVEQSKGSFGNLVTLLGR